jgi:hypothetical protein
MHTVIERRRAQPVGAALRIGTQALTGDSDQARALGVM